MDINQLYQHCVVLSKQEAETNKKLRKLREERHACRTQLQRELLEKYGLESGVQLAVIPQYLSYASEWQDRYYYDITPSFGHVTLDGDVVVGHILQDEFSGTENAVSLTIPLSIVIEMRCKWLEGIKER